MAREVNIFTKSVIAAADLSSSQFCAVKLDTSAKAALPGAGGQCFGIIQNKPKAAESASVMVLGQSKMVVGSAGVTMGDQITPDTAGKAVTAVSTNYVLGLALETGVSADIISVLLLPGGKV